MSNKATTEQLSEARVRFGKHMVFLKDMMDCVSHTMKSIDLELTAIEKEGVADETEENEKEK